MTEEEKATARVHLINAINWLECDGEEGMHIEEAVERIRLALAIIRPAETLSGAESGEELIDKILQEAQNLYKNDPDMTTEQSYRGAMRALLASRPAESGKTVPMEMLLAFRSYGRSMPEDTKRALLIEIAARYGYTVTEDKEEGR